MKSQFFFVLSSFSLSLPLTDNLFIVIVNDFVVFFSRTVPSLNSSHPIPHHFPFASILEFSFEIRLFFSLSLAPEILAPLSI